MNKKCSKCKEEKDLCLFAKNSSKKDGYQTFCKVCNSERSKKYYADNLESHREVIGVRRNKIRSDARKWVFEYLLEHPCTKCGYSDPRALEFDHLRDKFKDVSRMVGEGYSIESISNEIEKCQVLCAICHRLKTSFAGKWHIEALYKEYLEAKGSVA